MSFVAQTTRGEILAVPVTARLVSAGDSLAYSRSGPQQSGRRAQYLVPTAPVLAATAAAARACRGWAAVTAARRYAPRRPPPLPLPRSSVGGSSVAAMASLPNLFGAGANNGASQAKTISIARVYANANQLRPREYWDYENIGIEWGYTRPKR